MRTIVMILISVMIASACTNKTSERKKSEREIRAEKRELAIDSLYNYIAETYQAEKNWEGFDYNFLYQLQDFLEGKSGKFVVKNVFDYQIYRKDSSYYCALVIDEFNNDIFLELEISKEEVEQLSSNKINSDYDFYTVFLIEINNLRPIDIEFESELDDYYSRIVIDRYKSLFGTGNVQKVKFVKEKI